jgi:hypothetical protein
LIDHHKFMIDLCEALFTNKPVDKVFNEHAIARIEQQNDRSVQSEGRELAEPSVSVQESEGG